MLSLKPELDIKCPNVMITITKLVNGEWGIGIVSKDRKFKPTTSRKNHDQMERERKQQPNLHNHIARTILKEETLRQVQC